MSRTKNVLFFGSFAVIFASGLLTAWADHAGWGGLWVLVFVGVPVLGAMGVLTYFLHDEVATRLALRDENGDPVEFTDRERAYYEIFGPLPVARTPKR